MSAYAIFIRKPTNIHAEPEIYSQKAAASLAGPPIKVHVLYSRHEVIEGAAVEDAVILGFPSFEEAKQWYDIPAYRDARLHRLRRADHIGIIV